MEPTTEEGRVSWLSRLPISSAEFGSAQARLSNLTYLLCGQLGTAVAFTSCKASFIKTQGHRMSYVLCGRDVLKVLRAIVRLVSVTVIDLVAIGPFAKERRCNDIGYQRKAPSTFVTERYSEIAPILSWPRLEWPVIQPSYSSEVRDFVKVGETDNWPPFFKEVKLFLHRKATPFDVVQPDVTHVAAASIIPGGDWS